MVAVAVAFAAITAARFAVPAPGGSVGFLYVLPISAAAVRFGWRGGVAAGLLGVALTAVWVETKGVDIGVLGYINRTVVFLGMGVLVGVLQRERELVGAEASRWFAMSNDLLCVADLDGRFVRVNTAWTDLLGYWPDECRGVPSASSSIPMTSPPRTPPSTGSGSPRCSSRSRTATAPRTAPGTGCCGARAPTASGSTGSRRTSPIARTSSASATR